MPDQVTTRCVIYVRVSTKEQADNLSLETQEERCAAFAASKGWTVDRVFVEPGASAKTADREELQRLIEYCRSRKGRVHFLLVYAVSRFMRNTEEHLVVRGILARIGVHLRSATEPIEEGSAGAFVETILAAGAKFDNDVRSERTTVGMKAAAARGRWVWPAPLGYRNVRDEANRPTLVLDPERAPLVREAFELAAAGTSMAEIVRRLRARGLRGKGGAEFDRAALHYMLRRSVYAGVIRVKGWQLEAEGDFPAIVDAGTFRAAQAALGGRPHPVELHQRQHPDFPLRHFVRCAADGKPLTAYWSAGNGGRYAYYECPACRARSKRDALEDAFVALLDELRPRPAIMRLFKAEVLEAWGERVRKASGEGEALERRQDALRARKLKAAEAYAIDGGLDRETYAALVDKLDRERDEVEIALARARVDRLDADALVDYALHVITHAGALWRDAKPAQRVALQGFVFPAGLTWGKASGFVRTSIRGFEFSGLEASRGAVVGDGDPPRRDFEPFLRAAHGLREILPLAA
jgi:site-specific DNA recombinase